MILSSPCNQPFYSTLTIDSQFLGLSRPAFYMKNQEGVDYLSNPPAPPISNVEPYLRIRDFGRKHLSYRGYVGACGFGRRKIF